MQRGTRIVVRLIRVAVVTDESSELVQITVRTSSTHPTCGIPAIDAATMRSQQSSDLIVLVLDSIGHGGTSLGVQSIDVGTSFNLPIAREVLVDRSHYLRQHKTVALTSHSVAS